MMETVSTLFHSIHAPEAAYLADSSLSQDDHPSRETLTFDFDFAPLAGHWERRFRVGVAVVVAVGVVIVVAVAAAAVVFAVAVVDAVVAVVPILQSGVVRI